jgi:hypothetical protein
MSEVVEVSRFRVTDAFDRWMKLVNSGVIPKYSFWEFVGAGRVASDGKHWFLSPESAQRIENIMSEHCVPLIKAGLGVRCGRVFPVWASSIDNICRTWMQHAPKEHQTSESFFMFLCGNKDGLTYSELSPRAVYLTEYEIERYRLFRSKEIGLLIKIWCAQNEATD